MKYEINFKSGISEVIDCKYATYSLGDVTHKLSGVEFIKPRNAIPHYINIHQIESLFQILPDYNEEDYCD